MASIFDKWDKQVDSKALAEETKDLEENGGTGEYEEVPYGEYEVKIEKMELKECGSEKNKGLPMFSVQFRILAGDKENSCIFMNQLISQPFQIHIVNEFLRSLDSGIDVDFDGSYGSYNNLILNIHEAINGKLEYLLDYSQNKKGYNVFEIIQIYEV